MRLMSPFRKIFRGLRAPGFWVQKSAPLGAPFTWLLSGFNSFGFEFLEMIFNEVD